MADIFLLLTIGLTSYSYLNYIIIHSTYPQSFRSVCPETHRESWQNLLCTYVALERKSLLLVISPLFYIRFAISTDGLFLGSTAQ